MKHAPAMQMPNDSPQSGLSLRNQLLATVLEQLACPACQGDLRIAAAALVCAACGHEFPIVDGIPVLIATPTSPEK